MKKQALFLVAGLLFGVLFHGVYLTYARSQKDDSAEQSVPVGLNWRVPSKFSDHVVCSLRLSSTSIFENNKLNATVAVDISPTIVTFVDLDSDEPSMVGNLGAKAKLIKITNGNVLYLLEKTGGGNLNVFTLFRDKNIMTLGKQYDLFGTPFGLLMIGECLSGA